MTRWIDVPLIECQNLEIPNFDVVAEIIEVKSNFDGSNNIYDKKTN
jgi:hypothetical protein